MRRCFTISETDPEPPLRLEDVRELLRLDKAFYSSQNDGILRETVDRLKVAGKQILARPSLLIDAIRKCELKALWLPDRKRILIDSEMPALKQRWGEAHEVGHSLILWHEPLMHGDPLATLSLACHTRLEEEANFAAGRLLFLRDRFVEELKSSEINFDAVRRLHDSYGNTITSTLWRVVESLDAPSFGLVSIHPQDDPEEGKSRVRHFVRSKSFIQAFGSISADATLDAMRSFCYRRTGLIGEGELIMTDANGEHHRFHAQCFHNRYDALTLGVHSSVLATAV